MWDGSTGSHDGAGARVSCVAMPAGTGRGMGTAQGRVRLNTPAGNPSIAHRGHMAHVTCHMERGRVYLTILPLRSMARAVRDAANLPPSWRASQILGDCPGTIYTYGIYKRYAYAPPPPSREAPAPPQESPTPCHHHSGPAHTPAKTSARVNERRSRGKAAHLFPPV
jgi:hypothetical protein